MADARPRTSVGIPSCFGRAASSPRLAAHGSAPNHVPRLRHAHRRGHHLTPPHRRRLNLFLGWGCQGSLRGECKPHVVDEFRPRLDSAGSCGAKGPGHAGLAEPRRSERVAGRPNILRHCGSASVNRGQRTGRGGGAFAGLDRGRTVRANCHQDRHKKTVSLGAPSPQQ